MNSVLLYFDLTSHSRAVCCRVQGTYFDAPNPGQPLPHHHTIVAIHSGCQECIRGVRGQHFSNLGDFFKKINEKLWIHKYKPAYLFRAKTVRDLQVRGPEVESLMLPGKSASQAISGECP